MTQVNPNAAIKMRYEREIKKLVNRMTVATERELSALLSSRLAQKYFKTAEDSKKNQSLSTKAKIALTILLLKFQLLFNRKSKILAKSMIGSIEKYVSATIRRSLLDLTGKKFNTGVLSKVGKTRSQAIITENISLIKNIPQQYFTQLTSTVMEAIATGQTEQLQEQIVKHGRVSVKRALAIAEDQTHKATQIVAMQKLLDQGFNRFRWVYTYRSKEPRLYHVKRNGNIYSFDNLPGGELPSVPYNCKCKIGVVAEWEK